LRILRFYWKVCPSRDSENYRIGRNFHILSLQYFNKMPAETNLSTLLREMHPILNPGEYVFCAIPNKDIIKDITFIGLFQEAEGWTAVLAREVADELGLSYSFIASWITLTVHSALEAVGLTAAFAKALAEVNISCNMVAGFYHDHLFVPVADAEKAMEALQNLKE